MISAKTRFNTMLGEGYSSIIGFENFMTKRLDKQLVNILYADAIELFQGEFFNHMFQYC
jgi:hypothetical protein